MYAENLDAASVGYLEKLLNLALVCGVNCCDVSRGDQPLLHDLFMCKVFKERLESVFVDRFQVM